MGYNLFIGFEARWLASNELTQYGFSQLFQEIVEKEFPNGGSYMGLKSAIGL